MEPTDVRSVVAVGFCCADVYQDLERFYPTGNGVDWGVHLSRMGVLVSVVSVVGTDEYGVGMRKALAGEKIDISHMRIEDGDTCVMLMGLRNGVDRVHFKEVEGVMAGYALTPEDDAFVRSHQMFHTDLFGNVLDHLKPWHEAGIMGVMDFSVFSEDPAHHCEDYFPYVDYAFMSYDGDDMGHIRDWIRHVQGFGPRIVTATMGERGSLSYDGSRYYEGGIAVPPKIVNTVGAGDSYIAGFTFGLINGWDIPACQRRGAELASQVITKFEPY
ncbi:PfkB family carbohydrate kinase [Olsenella sp. Marseille-P4559]|uniref:PfkB family carbohydrate kinase n=1 Tax=Olsenella sp. Marseille-P4559 TaxID=2364795 RepID=UPI00102F9EF0|nr:PfkB family carbohydrate kinase [Olsenella sp. Marseille-P4559]